MKLKILQTWNGALFGINLTAAIDNTASFYDQPLIQQFHKFSQQNPLIEKYISKVSVYHDVGYFTRELALALTIKGIKKIIELLGLQIPVISHRDQFYRFISEVPEGKHAVAILGSGIFDINSTSSTISSHVFAVVYANGDEQDVLYTFDSAYSYNKKIRDYFSQNFLMFAPAENRQQYMDGSSTCHAYAIQDAYILQKKILENQPIINKRSISKGYHEYFFKLENDFQYDAVSLKKQLFKKLISYATSREANSDVCSLQKR